MREIVVAGVLVALAAAVAVAEDTRPEVFSDATPQAAHETAELSDKLLIVDAMTSWCAPCKRMDRTTWVDADVVRWIRANAIALQLDMDVHTDMKERLGITAFPTIVALKGGKEVDRVVGFRDAQQMMVWFSGLREGRTDVDRVREELAAARAVGTGGWEARASLVGQLMHHREDAEALVEYTWLWKHRRANGVESSAGHALAFGMRDLAHRHPPAAAAFTSWRDELGATLDGPMVDGPMVAPGAVHEWLALNRVIDDAGASADWADARAGSARGLALLQKHERDLFQLLVAEGRWRTAGLVLRDPVADTERQGFQLGAYDIKPEGETAEPATGGGSIPAIPMGGMKPATPVARTPEKKSGSMPAIPMGGMRPAVPMGGASGSPAAVVQTPEMQAAEIRRRLTHAFRRDASQRYAALLAAGRGDEADAVAAALLADADDDRARASLLAEALRADQMSTRRDAHLRWLERLAD